MSKYAGWVMGVYLLIDEVYERVAAIVTSSFSINGGTIETTNSDSSRWRELLAGGVLECQASGSGFLTDQVSHDALAELATTGEIGQFMLMFADQRLDLTMQVITLEAQGEYQGAQVYDLALVSADAPDQATTVQAGWNPASYSPSFGASTVDVTVARSGSSAPFTLRWTTTAGTTGLLSWASGDMASKTVTLDLSVEAYDWTTFTVTLTEESVPLAFNLSPAVATVSLATLTLTSRLYPLWVVEDLQALNAELGNMHRLTWPPEGLDASNAEITALSLTVEVVYSEYTDWPDEGLDAANAEITALSLESQLISYVDGLPEGLDAANAEITVIALETILITYANWPDEGLAAANATITEISLS